MLTIAKVTQISRKTIKTPRDKGSIEERNSWSHIQPWWSSKTWELKLKITSKPSRSSKQSKSEKPPWPRGV